MMRCGMALVRRNQAMAVLMQLRATGIPQTGASIRRSFNTVSPTETETDTPSSQRCSSVGDREMKNTTENIKEYDIIIVGGGMVGAALGCGLASFPLTKALRVAIIDGNPNLQAKTNSQRGSIPDVRVSAVTPATVSFFNEIGAWNRVQECRHAPFDKMQVWDYTGWGYTRYDARDVGKPILGYVVENKVLHNALLSCLQDTAFCDIINPAEVKNVLKGSNKSNDASGSIDSQRLAKVELLDGRFLSARLVVGADGGRSRVRSMSGIQTTSWDYKQHALICTVEVHSATETAWQRFLPSGPLALLPMGEKYCNIVLSTTPEKAEELKTTSEKNFLAFLNNALQHDHVNPIQSQFSELIDGRLKWFTGDVTPSVSDPFEVPPRIIGLSSERMSFPLSLLHAREYVSNRVVLVGDAAHTVHPLAGQGVNLGFADAAALAKIINEGLLTGSDIGEMSLLKKYERERKFANISMMAVLDGFQKVFSTNIAPINLLRAAAFNGVHLFGPLKRQIISYAMGEPKWPGLPIDFNRSSAS